MGGDKMGGGMGREARAEARACLCPYLQCAAGTPRRRQCVYHTQTVKTPTCSTPTRSVTSATSPPRQRSRSTIPLCG